MPQSYTCTIRFTDASRTVVSAEYDRPRENGKFYNGDDITFISPDGDWHVIFVESPFDDEGDPQHISGTANQGRRFFFNVNPNPDVETRYPFRCLINDNGTVVGWESAGGDPNVKPTRP